MTSVDSGVDTGNDSNDSSVAQHENLAANAIANGATAVATTSSSQRDEQNDDPGAFRIEFGPGWQIDLDLPSSSLCPVFETYNCAENSQSSTGTSGSGPVVIFSSKMLEFRLPPSPLVTAVNFLKSRSCYHGKMKSLHALHKSHPYITWRNAQEPLIDRKMRRAAATNNTVLMKKLLSLGASPNNHDDQGRTPLHLAACRGYTEMVRLLLEYGADPNRRDCIGNTPLHLATVTSKISVVTLLLKAGTNVLSSDQHGYNPLQLAQTKLRLLQTCKGADMLRVKEEVHSIVNMLMAYLQKQNDACEQVETLSTFCSRLSLSNTSDQIQDDVKDLLANIDSLSITS